MRSFNDKIVELHVKVLGSPYFLYFCWILDLVELPPVIAAHNLILWGTYISQVVIQLIALPSLQAHATIESAKADAREQKMAQDVAEIKQMLTETHGHLYDIKEKL